MAHADPIPAGALAQIADQVSLRLALLGPRWLAAPATIEESLTVWRLDAPPRAGAAPRDTGLWHHQIALGGAAEGYARSHPAGPPDPRWEVLEVFDSTLAPLVAAGIALVERMVPDDPGIRLLVAPEYQVHALWLVRGAGADEVLVVDVPGELGIPPNRLLPYADFVSALGRARPITGML